ncbi:MAG: FkbM family methyltransferase [Lachnospiraceae bacterium]|nr:FkbM family methyltransferase [Lachnospiraceae bacterium]
MDNQIKLTNINIDSDTQREYAIYGYGIVGRMLRKILERLEQKVTAFVCSDGYKTQDLVEHLSVRELSDYVANVSDKGKVLVTVQSGVEYVLEALRRYENLEVVLVNSAEDFDRIYRWFYQLYFEEKGVDISQDFLDLDGVKYLNPFKQKASYSSPFFSECGDLVLPAIYNDLSSIFEGPYERKRVKVEAEDVVIDCGSNMGLFSVAVANRCRQIYAFEPVPKAQEYILDVCKMYPNIQLCKYALGDYTGKVLFSAREDESYNNCIIKDTDARGAEGIYVDITTIDEFVKVNDIEKIDFIKADIEGAEREMLRGAKETLRKFAPKLSICEYHLPDDPEVLEKIILEANPNYIVEHDYMKLYAYVPQQ